MHFARSFALFFGPVLAGIAFSPLLFGLGLVTAFLRFLEHIADVLYFGVGGGALAFLLLYVVDVGLSHPPFLSPVWFVVACLASLLDAGLSRMFDMRPFQEIAALLFANTQGVANILEMLVKSDETLQSQAVTIQGLNASLLRLNSQIFEISQALHISSWELRKKTLEPAVAGSSCLWLKPSAFRQFNNRTDLYLVFLMSKLDNLQSVIADNTTTIAQLERWECEARRSKSELNGQLEHHREQQRRHDLFLQQRETERFIVRRMPARVTRTYRNPPMSTQTPHRVKPIGQAPAISPTVDLAAMHKHVSQFVDNVNQSHDRGFVTGPVPVQPFGVGEIAVGPSANSFVPEERPDVEMVDINDVEMADIDDIMVEDINDVTMEDPSELMATPQHSPSPVLASAIVDDAPPVLAPTVLDGAPDHPMDVDTPGLATLELAAVVVDDAPPAPTVPAPVVPAPAAPDGHLPSSRRRLLHPRPRSRRHPVQKRQALHRRGAPTQVLDVDEPEVSAGPSTFTTTTADREHQTVEYSSGTAHPRSASPANVSPPDVPATAAALPAAQDTAPGTRNRLEYDPVLREYYDSEYDEYCRQELDDLSHDIGDLLREDAESAQDGRQEGQRAATSTAVSSAIPGTVEGYGPDNLSEAEVKALLLRALADDSA